MLDRWGKTDEKRYPGINPIAALKSSEHMHDLVEQLLFLARGDAGGYPHRLSSILPRITGL